MQITPEEFDLLVEQTQLTPQVVAYSLLGEGINNVRESSRRAVLRALAEMRAPKVRTLGDLKGFSIGDLDGCAFTAGGLAKKGEV